MQLPRVIVHGRRTLLPMHHLAIQVSDLTT